MIKKNISSHQVEVKGAASDPRAESLRPGLSIGVNVSAHCCLSLSVSDATCLVCLPFTKSNFKVS